MNVLGEGMESRVLPARKQFQDIKIQVNLLLDVPRMDTVIRKLLGLRTSFPFSFLTFVPLLEWYHDRSNRFSFVNPARSRFPATVTHREISEGQSNESQKRTLKRHCYLYNV